MTACQSSPDRGRRVVAVALCLALAACNTLKGSADRQAPRAGGANAAAPAAKLKVGQCTLIGTFRVANDDALAVKDLPGSTLCLVADGFGEIVDKRALGQVACERAFAVLTRELEKKLPQGAKPDETQKVIREAIVAANADILAAGAKDVKLRNMGTTIVLALWRPGEGMYVAGVGDSRAYLVRGDTIEQLTVDHTLAQALLEAGTITAEEARTHRFRNVLWKYLGTKEVGTGPEVKLVLLQPRERILLCTDGIHGVVTDERIRRCLREHADVQKCAEALCQLALDSGSRDNVSAVVIEAGGSQ